MGVARGFSIRCSGSPACRLHEHALWSPRSRTKVFPVLSHLCTVPCIQIEVELPAVLSQGRIASRELPPGGVSVVPGKRPTQAGGGLARKRRKRSGRRSPLALTIEDHILRVL